MGIDLKACRLVIFDLDGTLVDTFGDIAAAVNFALKELGLSARRVEDVKRHVGNGARLLMQWAVQNDSEMRPSGGDDKILDRAVAYWMDYYLAHPADHARLYPGVLPMLQTLKSHEIKTAVLSNKFHKVTERLLTILQIRPFLDRVIGENDRIARKPAPDGIFYLMKWAKVRPQETWMVGDSEPDILAGRAAGCRICAGAYGVLDRAALERLGPHVIINSPMEIVS